MKLYRILILQALFLVMVSCQRAAQDRQTETESTVSAAALETEPPENETGISVVRIIDTTPEDMDPTMEEKVFYEDDQLRYFFYDAVSEYVIVEYSDGSTERGKALRKSICDKFGFASLEFQTLEGVVKAIGLPPEKLCTYCWNGKE